MGLLPSVFWEIRPIDFSRMAKGYMKRNQLAWERERWLATHLYLSSGNMKKGKRLKPQDLMELPLLDKSKPKKKVVIRQWTTEEILELKRKHGISI